MLRAPSALIAACFPWLRGVQVELYIRLAVIQLAPDVRHHVEPKWALRRQVESLGEIRAGHRKGSKNPSQISSARLTPAPQSAGTSVLSTEGFAKRE